VRNPSQGTISPSGQRKAIFVLKFFDLIDVCKIAPKQRSEKKGNVSRVGKRKGKFCGLVEWEVVQRPKERGGLGVGDVHAKRGLLEECDPIYSQRGPHIYAKQELCTCSRTLERH